MKKTALCVAAAFFCFSALSWGQASAAAEDVTEFRGVWVATTLNLDYPSRRGLDTAQLKSEADAILDTAAQAGFNAVIFQVRPSGDALYDSNIFPWSAEITGKQGEAPKDGFDPLEYWVDGAHSRGMELHAWVNPLRVSRANSVPLSDDNPAKHHPEWTVTYSDGTVWYDPGLPEVRELITLGVLEIVNGYDVDGIQFDDYFYPGADFADDETFKKHGGEFTDKNNWRRENTNIFIRGVYQAVKASREDCVFGVSPAGIWANKTTSSAFGSDTSGYESYSQSYADTRRWVKNGWLDYIAPQIYWEVGYAKADYAILSAWWADVVKGTGVKLYIGHAAWRTGESKTGAWSTTAEIERQVALSRASAQISGGIHFRFSFIANNRDLFTSLQRLYASPADVNSPAASVKMKQPDIGVLAVGRPADDMRVTNPAFYIVGASDPAKAVSVNGEEIENRTASGYFGIMVTLKPGENVFTFKQDGQTVTRKLTLLSGGGGGASAPPEMQRAEIVPGTAFPVYRDEIARPGDTLTLRCSAPIGASVSVRIAGKTINMKPQTTEKPDDGKIYRTAFTAEFKLPDLSVRNRIIPLGAPVYVMEYGDVTAAHRAAGSIYLSTPEAPYFAEVLGEHAFTYNGASTSGGSSGEISRGQRDFVTHVTGSGEWVRLSVGAWVQRADVRLFNGTPTAGLAVITSASVSLGDKWESLALATSFPGATTVKLDGRNVTLRVSGVNSAPVPKLPSDSMLSSVTSRTGAGFSEYTLTLKEGQRLDGYLVVRDAAGISLRLKRPPKAKTGTKPLEGIVILVDAGHGGSDGGAVGPLDKVFTESYFNLYAALKLQAELQDLGAQVHLTRAADMALPVQSRVNISRALLPDMFISLHCNSMPYETDATNIKGLSTWYRQALSLPLSQRLYESVNAELGLHKRGATQSNLYVCRPNWTPSVLVEQAFMCTPSDFEWLSSESNQNALAAAIANAVVKYFE